MKTFTHLCALGIQKQFPARMQQGFSLIEVLVSVIILSIGMLGAIGMQTTALQANKEARNQTIATIFARELAEKMRGNHTTAIKTTAATNFYLFDTVLASPADIASFTVNCFTLGCPLAADAAKWDVADWQTRVQATLPNPRVKVCFDKNPYDAANLPRWACTDDGDVAVLKMSWTRQNTAGTLELAASSAIPVVILPLTAGSTE